MLRFFDKQGRPISSEQWSDYLCDPDYQIINQTCGCGKMVSTVWLGLDHSHGTGKPVIFETMVFGSNGPGDELDCVRYSSLEEAVAGHERLAKEHALVLDQIVSAIERVDNTITVWSIQRLSAFERLQESGAIHGDWRRVDKYFKNPYRWLCDQMESNGIRLHGRCPMWAWAHKPDLRSVGHAARGEAAVRLELEVPVVDCLVSNFSAWHCVLNDHFMVINDAEMAKEFDGKVSGYTRAEISQSWLRIFDLALCADSGYGDLCQVTFPGIELSQVRKVTRFKGR